MTKYLAVLLLLVPCLLCAGDIPDNSHPKAYGSGWDCNRGYYKAGEKCEKVILPENAGLNVYGNGWACNRGYYKSGEKCEKVTIPENAGLNVYGNGWTCNRGYKTFNNGCVPMTSAELESQNALEQAILRKIQERRLQGVKGDDCETEYRTNARVCVRITNTDLECSKSYSGNYYRDCDATIRYDVETDYSGGSYLDVEVECKVEIEYKGRQNYTTQSDWGRKDESYTLYAHGSESERMVFNFSFSSFAEVHRVKIGSAKCEIESVDLR